MLKKLLDGDFSLSETFWKYGIFGVLCFRVASYVFEKLLYARIKGLKLADYYMHNFVPVRPDVPALLWTLCYLFTSGFLLYYCIAVQLGTWRSSESFDRSNLLKQLTRFLMIAFLSTIVYSIF